MLFHNRPVKAAMGSVIVNGGVQLSGGKSLVDTKLAALHFGGPSEDELAALNSRQSEIALAKVKVSTVHTICSVVDQLNGSYQLC